MNSILEKIAPKVVAGWQGQIESSGNPMAELLARGEVRPVGQGLYVFRGRLALLLASLRKRVQQLFHDFHAEEIYVPTLLSWDMTERAEYLKSFAHQALPVTDTVGGAVVALSCPTVCHHYFASQSGRTLEKPELVTAESRCSRNEAGEDLSRLKNFTMREIVGIGSREFCLEHHDRIRQRVCSLLQEEFDLTFDLRTAHDPFFGPDQMMKEKSQLLMESKLELHAALPFNASTLSVGSVNKHQGVFLRRFSISGSLAESFCVALGLERLLFAIVAQKGTDFDAPYYKCLLENAAG
jgi:hypothetical protein